MYNLPEKDEDLPPPDRIILYLQLGLIFVLVAAIVVGVLHLR